MKVFAYKYIMVVALFIGLLLFSCQPQQVGQSSFDLDDKALLFTAQPIVIHNGAANTSTNVVNTNFVVPNGGDYILHVSFNYNVNSVTAFGRVYATFDGNALDLNNRSTDLQGDNQILLIEVKDAGNSNSGAITGTGSGNKINFYMPYLINGLSAGTYPFVLDMGVDDAGVNGAMWNVIVRLERID